MCILNNAKQKRLVVNYLISHKMNNPISAYDIMSLKRGFMSVPYSCQYMYQQLLHLKQMVKIIKSILIVDSKLICQNNIANNDLLLVFSFLKMLNLYSYQISKWLVNIQGNMNNRICTDALLKYSLYMACYSRFVVDYDFNIYKVLLNLMKVDIFCIVVSTPRISIILLWLHHSLQPVKESIVRETFSPAFSVPKLTLK